MKDSLGASLLAAGAKYVHGAMGTVPKSVHSFLHATEFVGEKLAQGGIPATSLRHVPLYIDRSRFASRSPKADYLVYAGRLVREKGLATLFQAMRALPDVKLRLLGDGPMRAELDQLARDMGLRNIEFAGFLDEAEYVAQLGGARALVLPSELYETCGLVMWEAMTMGVPVIASRIGGIPESIVENETGLSFEPGNAQELTDKIRQVLGDSGAAARMAARGDDLVRAHCESHYERIMGIYDEAIAGAGK